MMLYVFSLRNASAGFTITAFILGVLTLALVAGCDNKNSNNGSLSPGQSSSSKDDQMYASFKDVAIRSNIDLGTHPSYTKNYVVSRAHYFCDLMRSGDITKLTSEITFPPVQSMTENTNDRSRLEAVILKTGPPAYCSDQNQTAENWLRTYSR